MIGRELAAFLEEGIGIELATRNRQLEPSGARVIAVKVDEDGTHLTAYVPKTAAARVLPDLRDNGRAAIVFARPPDERACQVKGDFAGARPATAAEKRFVLDQGGRWIARLESIGYPPAAWTTWESWPCVAIRIRVAALFNQTPGPNAGAAL